jgi:serine/threonine protein kinase
VDVRHRVRPRDLGVLGGGPELEVLDFGIARIEGDEGLTKTGALIGTPAAMAPEAALGAIATRASDVWSLAAALRFAATGKLPHEPATTDLSPELAALLARAMNADPTARLSDGSALVEALAAISLATGGAIAVAPAPLPRALVARARMSKPLRSRLMNNH